MIFSHILNLVAALKDYRPPPPASSSKDCSDCERDRLAPELGCTESPVIDLSREASKRRYRSGRNKLHRYPPANLRGRRIVIVLHQTGFEVRDDWPWHKVTAHTVVTPAACRARLYPLRTRLVAANALDRAPYHAINFEVAGNFEGNDGEGDWWNPSRQGRGRASDAQITAVRHEIRFWRNTLEDLGLELYGVAPHRISGRNKRGRPNRGLCCGSRVWREAGEWSARTLGLRVPPLGFTVGGLPVDPWAAPDYEQLPQWEVAA